MDGSSCRDEDGSGCQAGWNLTSGVRPSQVGSWSLTSYNDECPAQPLHSSVSASHSGELGSADLPRGGKGTQWGENSAWHAVTLGPPS